MSKQSKNFRKNQPAVQTILHIELPDTEMIVLQNGIKLMIIPSGTQDIFKIEIVHKAGRSAEDTHLAARATSLLMREGTASMNAESIAKKIDYYGASIKAASNMDFSYSTLYTLGKFLPEVLPVFVSLYTEPAFRDDEIVKFRNSNSQKLLEELSKNDVISYRQITSEIFGDENPYGYNSEVEDYLALTRTNITDHYDKYYGTDNCWVFLSGNITPEMVDMVSNYLSFPFRKAFNKEYKPPTKDYKGNIYVTASQNEHQAAIKLGRRLFNRSNPDHAAFYLLNVILGGYFGSRLMSNVREKLGYTYDIFSSMDQMLYDGLFYVSTEVSPEFVQPTIDEIYRQMDILCRQPVSDDELQMVKNYIMGNFLNFMDGPLNVSTFMRSLTIAGIDHQDFRVFNEKIINMKPSDILDVASKYLKREEMAEVRILPEV